MMSAPPSPQPSAPVSFGQALRFWFWLGCVSFGGPAGQIALMHEELVVRRRWISISAFPPTVGLDRGYLLRLWYS